MARAQRRRWTNLRTSASGRTMADAIAHRDPRKPSGKKVELPKVEPGSSAPPGPRRRHMNSRRAARCAACGDDIPRGGKIVYFPPQEGRKAIVICRACETPAS